ncbi:hypothetical protein KY289_016867 [Solanum tuberosum]|nr:hypothetical protein KY284_016666 [Solanum tuberosum]KAH0689509.1 hypothetical protein KY289_016867 [Solanum tuberosum]
MESYLVGKDLWDAVNGSNTSPPVDGPKNSSAYKKWKKINEKVEFILKRTISSGLFDHIIRCKSTYEIWKTLDQLFNKKNEAQLQILKNELSNTTQEWTQYPSLEEFENLLSSRKLLDKQLVGVFVEGEGNALVADKRNFKGKSRDMLQYEISCGSSLPGKKEEPSNYYGKKLLRCYRCGKIGHIKRYCRAKESNMDQKVAAGEEEEEWEKFLVAEARTIDAMISINLERDWIEDSKYNTVDHVEEQDNNVISMKQETSEDVYSGDMVVVIEEILNMQYLKVYVLVATLTKKALTEMY